MSPNEEKLAVYFTGGVAIGSWLLALSWASPLQLILCALAFLAGIELARVIWQRNRSKR